MISITVQCTCGQAFVFDVEPLNGQMPCTVACPTCGQDATHAANEQLQAQLGTPAPAPAPRKENTKWLVAGLCVAVTVLLGLIAVVYFWAYKSPEGAPRPEVAANPAVETVKEPAGATTNPTVSSPASSPVVSTPTVVPAPPSTPATSPKPSTTTRDPSYVAVGALFDRNLKNGKVEITRVIANSPAKKAKIVAGDILIKVDGAPIQEMKLKDIADLFYGPVGSTISLDFASAKNGKPKHVEIVRQKYTR